MSPSLILRMCGSSLRILRISVLALACVFPSLSTAAQVTAAEYFIGSDPGAGSGIALVLQDSNSLGSGIQQLSFALAGRAPGTYTVGIRVRDDQGRWSNPALRRFTIQPGSYELAGGLSRNGSADQDLRDPSDWGIGPFAAGVTAEYFVGNDPGAGYGIPLGLQQAGSLASSFAQVSLALAEKQAGTYTVGIRIRDGQGRWSNPALRRFTVHGAGLVAETTVSTQSALSADLDPPVSTRWSLALGDFVGNRITLNAGGFPLVFERLSNESSQAFFTRLRTALATDPYTSSRFNVGALSSGSFTLTAKSPGPASDFELSSQELEVVLLENGSVGAAGRKIVAAEYFWDLDPGKGGGTSLSVSTTGNEASAVSKNLSLAELLAGNHRVGVRFKNAAGRWGNPIYRGLSSFVLFGEADLVAPSLSLTGAARLTIQQGSTYLEPGVTALDGVDGNLSSKVVVTVGVDPTRSGLQTVEYAVVDRAGNISRIEREVEVLAVGVDVDANSNGLPDSWEAEFFPAGLNDPEADADGDGTTNRMEYLAGTHPGLASSVFRPNGSVVGGVYTLPIPTVEGRKYEVWATRDLASWHLRQTLIGDGNTQNFVFDESAVTSGPLHQPGRAPRCFFRVEVSQP